MTNHRLKTLAISRLGLTLTAQHTGNTWPINIGIENSNRCTFGLQCQRQVYRRGGFTDTTLTGGHSDNVLYPSQWLQILLHRMRFDLARYLDIDIADAFNTRELIAYRLLQSIEITRCRVPEYQGCLLYTSPSPRDRS